MGRNYVFVTDEEYAKAEKLGISKMNIYYRIHQMGWSKEKALTQPVRKKISDPRKENEKSLAYKVRKSGINYSTIQKRLKRGMSLEEALTTPPMSRERIYQLSADKRCPIPLKAREKAKLNGISMATVMARIRNMKWDVEKACTTPVRPREVIK